MTRRRTIIAVSAIAILLLGVVTTTRFHIGGHFEGLFLLKGNKGSLWELKDDLYLGDGYRFIGGIDFDDPRYHISHLLDRNRHKAPYLYYEWNARDGEGFVRNYLPGGQQMLTCFSRFSDDGGKQASGLFVGGGLPTNVEDDHNIKANETGMAFFDGKRWFHIWCNVNEAIASGKAMTSIYPSQWIFIGSRVLNASDKELTLCSSHTVSVDNVPLRIDRIADFKAGERFFTLSFRVTNVGTEPSYYFYLYGDEPWLGNYGTSGGNVGWVKDRLIQHVGAVDTRKYAYAGLFDYGNEAIGEGHNFTMTANFLEWKSPKAPMVYFSNSTDDFFAPVASGNTPLSGNARFIGVQWGPSFLPPGVSDSYTLAIGMAGRDPKTGLPVKPETHLD